jgi:tetratricopeptide (TPR) repeat protein
VYTPAVGPRLKILLAVIFAVVALLGANSVYLVAITVLGEEYQNQFYMFMFLLHLLLGLGLLLPFLVFAFSHLRTAYNRPNRRAVRAGIALLSVSIILIASGFVLMRLNIGDFRFEVKDPRWRSVAYWAHVLSPLLAIAFYVTHRMAGPIIKWRWAWAWASAVGAFVLGMGFLHHLDPRGWYTTGPKEGSRYFAPSAARTATGNFIPAPTLMMDQYCQKCHPDAYEQHYKSVHHFSSFNNKPYLFSVNETRQVSLKRDGTVQASRWCAGCHDPVPFFSGEFDDPDYDIKDKTNPTTQAGITCTVCHAITNINSVTGNADYTIDEPMHYPFATSENEILQWINNQLVKAKPALHKKTFMKDKVHRNEEFCSTCHKVSLPFALNHYKEFLRGQNHYDPFLLSGQSGHGARSFYYPDKAKDRCSDCHMPLVASNDFGAQDFDSSGTRRIHNHFFFGANTGLPFLRNYEMLLEARKAGNSESQVRESPEFLRNEEIIRAHQEFLRDGQMRVDIFALRKGGTIEGELLAPLRPDVPVLEPGGVYLVEVVLRTLKLGHLFTQGTIDSNEVWVDFEAQSGGRIIGRSGGIDDEGTVDPWSHFVNALIIDRKGERIDRRNPQDIYVPVYNHQIPPGAGQVVHYLLQVPEGITQPVRLTAKLRYRKFDRKYMEHVFRDDNVPVPNLPITTLCEDTVTLPVDGLGDTVENAVVKIPEWQRWNDYGIGLFLEGDQSSGSEKGELRQAEAVFKKVVELGQGEGHANLARIYVREKRLADAVQALQAAAKNTDMVPFATAGAGPGQLPGIAQQYVKPASPWVVAWVTGLVNKEIGQLDDAIKNFELILSDEMYQAVRDRAFDFRRDYQVWNELGIVRFERAEQERGPKRAAERERRLREAVNAFEHTLALDPEDLTAHFNLALLYGILAGESADESSGRVTEKSASVRITAEDLRRLVDDAAPAGPIRSNPAGASAATKLAQAIPSFLAGDRDPFESRLSTLVEILRKMQNVYRQHAHGDPEMGKAVASVLQVLHRELHLMFKLDDNAREAVAIHRQNNPAANHAAQSIVIYPLNRQGAPGLAGSTAPVGTSNGSGAGVSVHDRPTALRE